MSDEAKLLGDISRKLDQLIILWKIANSKAIKDKKDEICKDKASRSILKLADGSLPTTELKQKTVVEAKVSLRTVEARINSLLNDGALIARRKGQIIYYENSGLYM